MTETGFFEIQAAPQYALITFRGELDANAVLQARPALLEKIPPACPNFIIDLTSVDFLDSHGVGLFVSLLKRAHQNHGRIAIAGAQGQPSSVLHMVGFNGALVSYCTNASEAKALFAQKGQA